MEELPFAAGLQIIDADLAMKGVERRYVGERVNFDALTIIDNTIAAATQ